MIRFHHLALALALVGCRQGEDDTTDTDIVEDLDNDADGSPVSEDCDDEDPSAFPGATEACDGVDNDCDGAVDDGVLATFYGDADGDGYGDAGAPSEACEAPAGHVSEAGDCDDTDAAYHPGATEDDCTDPNDYNCDGSSGFADADGDGAPACEDCDDADAAINPSAAEACDGVDNDCDAEIDEAGATGESIFYADTDGDGYGDVATTAQACAAPEGYVSDASDCDDAAASSNPAALEACGGADEDCDGETDEAGASGEATFYADADADGYGDVATTATACAAPEGYVPDATDCDDAKAGTKPGAAEACDGEDGDCDGVVPADEVDDDGDGETDCAGDCDDSRADVGTAAEEKCDAADNDCDGTTDEDDAVDAPTWFLDGDADGYGSDPKAACAQPTGYAEVDGDCADDDAAVHPGAVDACNEVDDDCDGTTDDAATALGEESACAAASCLDILETNAEPATGTWWLAKGDGTPYQARCDMDADGGGWTLIGVVKNTGPRSWNKLVVFTDPGTFGALSDLTEDYKSFAWTEVAADDYLVRTDEYAFGFNDILTGKTLGSFIKDNWPTSCNTTFLKSGADYVEELDANQQKLQVFILRPLDNNSSCFEGANENAVIGHHVTDAWTPGIGNCPSCQGSWTTHDLSLMKLTRVTPQACTGGYPCNGNGFKQNAGSNCYDASCNVQWAQIWVR